MSPVCKKTTTTMSASERAKLWRKNNPEKAKERDAKYRLKKKEWHKEYVKLWYNKNKANVLKKNKAAFHNLSREQKDARNFEQKQIRVISPEKNKRYTSKWRKLNPGIVTACTQRRNANKMRAQPSWANKDKIQFFYEMSAHISKISGIKHHVDHIVPLQSPLVCGLHCEYNLQVIPASENVRKSNKL